MANFEHNTANELTSLFGYQLAKLIKERQVSPVEVARAHLERISAINPAINAIVTLSGDVVERAKESERSLMSGVECGPLHGVPFTVKDSIETARLRTTAGSRLFSDHIPVRDAPAVARLKSAGAILLGKTNLPEMATTYESVNEVFGRTLNPVVKERSPGGSSGGEAAAIAAHLSPFGLGSDLAGSIRIPAAFCGIYGLKPTPGVVPNSGHIPPVETELSGGAALGPLARSTADLRLVFDQLIVRNTFPPLVDNVNSRRPRVGRLEISAQAPVEPSISAAIELAASIFKDEGYTIEEVSISAFTDASDLWMKCFAGPVAKIISDLYGEQGQLAGPLVQRLIRDSLNSGNTLMVEKTDFERELMSRRDAINEIFSRFDLVLAPIGSVNAFPHGTRQVNVQGRQLSVFRAFGVSQAANVFGLPAIAVPMGKDVDGVPIGVQIIGPPFSEYQLLSAAEVLERNQTPAIPSLG